MSNSHVSVFAFAAGHGEANTAARILEAAVCEFDERGYENTSFAGVAARSGVSKSLVSYHFPTKALLGSAVLNLAYPGGVFMGSSRVAGTAVEMILHSATSVASDVTHNPLARAALKLRREASVKSEGSPGWYSGWLARIADYLIYARQQGLVPSTTDIETQARLVVSGVVGQIAVAVATGNYLSLTSDVHIVTRDRLIGLGAVIEASISLI